MLCTQYWDADRFEQVFDLAGHKAEVLSLALTPKGTTLYSTSADKSLREWVRTDEIVLLDEEQDKRLDSALEKGIDEVSLFRALRVGWGCDAALQRWRCCIAAVGRVFGKF